MTLDPQAREFLDFINSIKSTPLQDLGAAKARETYAKRPDDWAPAWVDLYKVEDRLIPGKSTNIPVRIYRPEHSAKPLPVLVFYHGGGMVIGTLDSYDTLCRQLAKQSGCIVVSVDYQLAPENKFPCAVYDAYDALLWVKEQATSFGGNNESIAVGGDSAGGTLSAVVSLLDRDKQEPSIKFQLLIYPATASHADADSHHRYAKGYFLERETVLWFHQSYIRSEEDRQDFRYAPLIAKSHQKLPPALVIIAGHDTLRDEGIAYAKQLEASGVDVELQEYPGMFHPFVSLAGLMDEGKRAIAESARALQKHLLTRY